MRLQDLTTVALNKLWGTIATGRLDGKGKLLGLKWDRTVLDIGELKIVETVVPVNHKPKGSIPKTDVGFRTIPLDTRTIGSASISARPTSGSRRSGSTISATNTRDSPEKAGRTSRISRCGWATRTSRRR